MELDEIPASRRTKESDAIIDAHLDELAARARAAAYRPSIHRTEDEIMETAVRLFGQDTVDGWKNQPARD